MGKFDKKDICGYCSKKMDAKYRSKRFCSDKCRVYFNRENVKFDVQKTDKNKNVEMSKSELLKLMRENGEF